MIDNDCIIDCLDYVLDYAKAKNIYEVTEKINQTLNHYHHEKYKADSKKYQDLTIKYNKVKFRLERLMKSIESYPVEYKESINGLIKTTQDYLKDLEKQRKPQYKRGQL
ncbi:MAG TPA: hypothetical protein PKJ08_09145 [Candidatus Cloacimonadota bacterium]|nr:hypothetical protein [Candidatus Cloacimonadota bacterium]